MKNNWNQEEDNIILNNWNKVKNITELTKFFDNRNYNAIKARCAFLKLRKCYIYYKNDNFFSIPNLINSYWAGMLSTDGHLRVILRDGYESYQVQLGLKYDDIDHIKEFQMNANSNHKISIITKNSIIKTNRNPNLENKITTSKMAIIVFTKAKQWAEDLYKNWNIPIKNKTFDLKRPNIKDFHCCLAYLKALLDGDGTIIAAQFQKRMKNDRILKYKVMRLSFLGTEDLMNWVKEFTDKICSHRKNNRHVRLERKDSNIYNYNIDGTDAALLYDLLSELPCPSLYRKWNNKEVWDYVNKQKLKFPDIFKEFKENSNSLSQSIISV